MNERQVTARKESVVDEMVFFDGELGVSPLQIARAIIFDPLVKREVLRASGRANRIGLNEPEPVDRPRERRWCEEASRNRKSAEIGEGDGRSHHGCPKGRPKRSALRA